MERINKLASIKILAHTTFPGRSYGTATLLLEHMSH
jgi:hypothetical protein